MFYSSTMAVDNDPSRGAGRSWKSFFNVSNKEEAEKRMTELGYTWKWLEGSRSVPFISNIVQENLSRLKLRHWKLPKRRRMVERCSSTNLSHNTLGTSKNFPQWLVKVYRVYLWTTSSCLKTEPAWMSVRMISYSTISGLLWNPFSCFVEALEYARQICEETAIEIKWQQGDVALLDNMLVMHARRDYDGNRRVLASLVK